MPQRGQPTTPQMSPDQFMAQRAPSPLPTAGARGGSSGSSATPPMSPDDFMRSRAPQPLPGAGGEERTLGGFASNVIDSTYRLGSDLAHMFRHPGETLEGIGQMAKGAYQNVGDLVNRVGGPGTFELMDTSA